MPMRTARLIALVFAFAMSLVVVAQTIEDVSTLYLVTHFDFTGYPACTSSASRSCIQGIRFYDADSNALLVEVEAKATMTGQERIVGVAKLSQRPQRVYAVTLYVDHEGRLEEGPRGPITEFVSNASN